MTDFTERVRYSEGSGLATYEAGPFTLQVPLGDESVKSGFVVLHNSAVQNRLYFGHALLDPSGPDKGDLSDVLGLLLALFNTRPTLFTDEGRV